MKLTLGKQIQLAFATALLLLLTLGFLAYQSADSLREALRWEEHTQKTLLQLDDTLALAIDAETGGRGFIITGNDTFLEPFRQTERKINQNLMELRGQITDNPKQVAELGKLETLINEKLKFTRELIEIRRTQGLADASDKIESEQGKKIMDLIRLSIEQMREEEKANLKQRETDLDESISNTLFILFFGTGAGIISLALANLVISRENRKRHRAEDSLRLANKSLEKRVSQRTEELFGKNLELKEQIKQRELSEQRRRIALEAGSLGTWTIETENDLAEADERSLSIFGLSVDGFQGTRENFFSRIYEEDFAQVEQSFNESVKTGKIFNREFRVRASREKIIWTHCIGQPQFDENGKVSRVIGYCRDITDAKQSELALRRSEQNIRNIIDNLFAYIAVLSPEGFVLEINRTALEMSQPFVPEQIIGKHFAETDWWSYSEDVKEQLYDAIERAAIGERVRFDTNVRIGNGKFLPIDFMIAPLLDESGNITHLIPSGFDLTPRIEAEDALRRSEHFARAILDSLSAHIAVVDKNGEIIAVNNAWQNFAKANSKDDELAATGIGQNYLTVCGAADSPDETAQIVLKNLRAILDGGQNNFAIEYPCHSPTEDRWFLLQISRMQGEAGGAVISHINITSRKKAEFALQKSKEQLDFTLDVAQLGVWGIVLETGDFNRSLRHDQIFGYENFTPDWSYEKFLTHILPEDEKGFDSHFRKVVADNSELNYEIRIRRTDGEIRWIWLRGQTVEIDGGLKQILGTIADITERKKAEREREKLLNGEKAARKDAEIANRLRDEFLATVSHELRAPLNSILGWGRLLEKGSLDEKTSEKAVNTIVRNAESQNRLIEDLLDVSRIISGKLRLEVVTVKPVNILESALETVRPAAEAKNIKLEIKEAGEVSHISGDPNRLQQVIWNLLSNAIKFTPNDGKVTLEIERMDDFVELHVKDTGVGIKQEFLPHVFDRFRQADASSIRKFGGLGLGLAIVRHITEMHGGTVHVSSAGENLGSIFTVRLPLINLSDQDKKTKADEKREDENMSLDSKLSLDGLLVLVVDDEEDTRQLLVQSLTFYGATVISAQSAEQALEEINKKKPDVLVSDIGMPDEDGYSLIGKVRNLPDEQLSSIKAIALTAFTRAQDRVRALSSGYQNHVSKPVEPDELATVIASLTGRLQMQKVKDKR